MSSHPPSAGGSQPPPLSSLEARVVGSLVEKAAITPEAYPLTLNALVAACNQKTSREPVMELEPGAVEHALRQLEARGLVRIAASSQRALRYEHRFDDAYGTTARQRALLCVLLLRGPQTLAELQARSDRLAQFPSLDDVRDTLERLQQRDAPLVVRLARGAGQREDRYMHLLGGPIDVDALAALQATAGGSGEGGLRARVERLEAELQAMRTELAELRLRFDALSP
jgi:uncharacterized protein YceH (UPF0502 family)